MLRRSFYFEPMKHEARKHDKQQVTGFQVNEWYEQLINKRDKGKQDITLLSSQTQEALSIYEEQKRRAEKVKA